MFITPTPFEALEEAVRRAGSQVRFAEICGITQPSVWKMLQSAKKLTAEYVLAVEAATNVSRHYLRPDLYPVADVSKLVPMHESYAPARLTAPRKQRQRRKAA